MRAHITINADGITQPSVEPKPPDGGAHIKRDNKSLVVTLSANPTATALSVLIRSLRVVETSMELDGAGALNRGNYTRPQLCIMLSQMALNRRESEFAPYFTSRIEILSGGLLDIDILPQNLLRLGQLSLGNLDVPTALLRVSEADIQNLVSIGQTMSMKLSFIAARNSWFGHPRRQSLARPLKNAYRAPPRNGCRRYSKPRSPSACHSIITV